MTERSARKRPTIPDCESRKQRAIRRLGSENPACCHCGFSDWRALQLHHAAGRVHDGITVILCANCHAILSDAQGDHPPITDDTPTMLDRIGRLLVNLADFFGRLGAKMKEFGEFLINLAQSFTEVTGHIK
jgi:hypothetical protein